MEGGRNCCSGTVPTMGGVQEEVEREALGPGPAWALREGWKEGRREKGRNERGNTDERRMTDTHSYVVI